jgi:hypothetical protein
MRKLFYLSILSVGLIGITSCKKGTVEIPFNDPIDKPYSTGIIKLQYQVATTINGYLTLKDTTVNFTSIGNNPSENDYYGYSQPSIPWVQLKRLNPNDFQNKAVIFFAGTNLNSLTLPYKFKAGDFQNAQINYVTGLKPFYDANGNIIHGTITYAGSTHSDNFELTVLSRVSNRLQGTFSGVVTNQDGLTIDIEKGLFDIVIVEK